jgi:hypothetical protein
MKYFVALMILMVCEVGNAQIVSPPLFGGRTCTEIAADISQAQLAITGITAEKTAAQASYVAAQASLSTALANQQQCFPGSPMWQYYEALSTYYAAQVLYYSGAIIDAQYCLDKKIKELADLQAESTAKGC